MHFTHAIQIWRDFPELVPGVLSVKGVRPDARFDAEIARLQAVARTRLASTPEGELPEIQAWRRAFTRMGLKPTQYRCAAESLLRRFRKDDALPQLHPLIDVCNAASLAFAIPVAVLDTTAIEWPLTVRRAAGNERYVTFAGEIEQPDVDEVIFADAANHAHARRWCHRQSGDSAVHARTADALIVVEGMHASAAADVRTLLGTLSAALTAAGMVVSAPRLLSAAAPEYVA
ncbi:tRNA synthetase subunit beta [Ralstonia sp. A12]|uniref:B3/B4 domain-containing protein n=1 Tax=Ralstonia sp. A12 TaxID=1217052 RepID=UPI000573B081|nr:phenylalanine--tRNA ligase beta subunit-related protein [Ralstonia sp. A12]KHK50181.1 tRNA synthetase subunit beta [Ralstonia sp. A12]